MVVDVSLALVPCSKSWCAMWPCRRAAWLLMVVGRAEVLETAVPVVVGHMEVIMAMDQAKMGTVMNN